MNKLNLLDYEEFLQELIKIEIQSNRNRKVVYPFLAQHQNKLNLTFAKIITQWFKSKIDPKLNQSLGSLLNNIAIDIVEFPLGQQTNNIEIAITCYENALTVRTKDAFPQDWADIQNNLANAYSDRIKGSKADNLERAIAGYKNALTVRTKDAFPQDWAMTQNNLGAAYSDRIKGSKADNLESAITCYKNALTVRTKDAFPQDWAMTQNNLANAYSQRIKGSKANNIESAIICLQNVLTIFTKDTFPHNWAMTQNNLGETYRNRIKGSKVDNLELAITCYENALTVRTKDSLPQQWAMTQNNLANAYSQRIKGSKADNQELAISCYQNALTILNQDDFPEDWAMAQNNLGETFRNRIKGEKADNLESAIKCYLCSLTVRTKNALPEQWAQTQNNLGLVYSDRIKGEKADNIESAITCLKSALTVRTKNSFPEDWAVTQNNLGLAYWERIKGAKADNIEKAIACFHSALTVRTKDSLPEKWAMTQNNLALAYRDRIKGKPEENINKAIKLLRATLQIRKPDNLPQDCLRSARNLGNLGFDQERWDLAKEGYLLGIEAVEKMCEWSPPEAHQRIREDALDVYEKMILACLNSDDLATALATVERSKSRIIVQMLFDANLQPTNATPSQLERFKRLRKEYLPFYPVNNPQTDNPDTTDDQPTEPSARTDTPATNQQKPNQFEQIKQERQRVEQALNDLLKEINDPDFSLTQKITPIQLSEIQNLLDEKTVILDWYILGENQKSWLTFIVTKDHIQVKHFTDQEQYQTLQQWQQEYFKDYKTENYKDYKTENYEKKGQPWSEKLTERLQKLSNILGINEILQAISDEKGELLYQKLILIPHQFLHILPLAALPAQVGEKTGCLMELFPQGVHFVPNCRLLERLQQRQNLLDPQMAGQLFAVQNPTKNLPYADVEVETIKKQIANKFQIDPTILAKTTATKNRLLSPEILDILKKSKYLHFACHAGFNSENPTYSALRLAKEILNQSADDLSNNLPTDNLPTDNSSENLPEEEKRLVTIRNGERFDPLLEGLTMQEIVAKLDLRQAILVILSACETGLINWQRIDEYIGLPSSFLLAGALRVIASNWLVDDFTTAFLMVRAYYNYLTGEYTITQSLQQAQIWLKNVSRDDFIKWLKDDLGYSELDCQRNQLKIKSNYQGDRPFNHPKYWASFSSIGLV